MSVSVTDIDPTGVTPRGGHYINTAWFSGTSAIEVRRPSDNQIYGEIPDPGSEVVDRAVAFCAPTILDGVTADSEAVCDEILGPVLTVQRFDEEEERIALANDSAYGPAAGVHTSNLNRAMRAVRAIQAGTVWVNRYGRTSYFILRTAGYKRSGIGKDMGRGLREQFEIQDSADGLRSGLTRLRPAASRSGAPRAGFEYRLPAG